MVRSLIGPALYEQRAISRHDLENDLRAWYLRTWHEEHIDPGKHRYFTRRRTARRWFGELCENRHFRDALAAFRREQEPLSRAISLVSWLKEAQKMVNNQFIPYKKAGRLSVRDKLDTRGGLQVLLSPELGDRIAVGTQKRPATIAGLLDFLGVPSTAKEVTAALRIHARQSTVPTNQSRVMEITKLLCSWESPSRER